MKNFLTISFVTLALIIPVDQIQAKEDKELRKQRQEAQKERQAEKNERSREIADAPISFREFIGSLKNEYSALLKKSIPNLNSHKLTFKLNGLPRLPELKPRIKKSGQAS